LLFHVAGISFLPYHGAAAYTAQVLDSSSVPTQAVLPGVAYSAVTTLPIQTQMLQYSVQPAVATSSYAVVDHSAGSKNSVVPAASSVPSAASVNNVPSAKQPLQSINLTDLLDYSFLMEHGIAETAGSVDLRSPAVLANVLQSLNASTTQQAGTETRQPQFSVLKPPQAEQPAYQQTASADQQHTVMALSSQQTCQQLYAGYASGAAVTTAMSQQKDPVAPVHAVGGAVLWPWTEGHVLSSDKAQQNASAGVISMPVSSISYEAVSPPAAGADNLSTFGLLDNLQLGADVGGYQLAAANFLGASTVDTSALFAAAVTPCGQQPRTDTAWNSGASLSAAYPASARLQVVIANYEIS